MRVQLVDPSAFTPPYDHSLAAALARAGADVELVTSRFLYGPVPAADGYRVSEAFYRRAARRGLDARGRMALKLVEHVPDMLRYDRHARQADVVHWQWLTVQPLDVHLLARKRPRVLTAHDVVLDAWRAVSGAELWIVGMPRMDIGSLRERASANVRFVPRFVTDLELPAFFRRADLVVLPYREIDQSGVLYTALAFGKPIIASAVGGFSEIDALRLVPPGDAAALAEAIADLLARPEERDRLAAAAVQAAAGPY